VSIGLLLFVVVVLTTLFAWVYFDSDTRGTA